MTNSVWVGSLPEGVDDETFQSIFIGYGELVSTKVFPEKWYGFAEFGTEEEARQVAAELDGAMVGGKGIKCRFQEQTDKGKSLNGKGAAGKGAFGKAAPFGKGKSAAPYDGGKAGWGGNDGGKGPHQNSDSNLWIGNLPDGMDDAGFRAIVESFGTLVSTKVFPEKWFGFADFSTPEEAAYAMESLQGAEYDGKPLKVKLATKKDAGGGSGSVIAGGFANAAWGAKGGYQQQQSWGTKADPWGQAKGGKGKPFAAPSYGGKPGTAADCAAGQGAHCASHYHILSGQNPAFSKGTKEGNLFVKGIPEPADDLMLYKLFAPFGQVLSVCTKATQYGTIGFVQYETAEQAEAAVGYMHGKEHNQKGVLDVSIKK